MRFFPWNRYDQDAWAWIQATEQADAQHLELGVRVARDKLVRDLKDNGLWLADSTMIVKMGARTLAGILVDVFNPNNSWTNNNFVSGDYNRTTGLVGNGSTKYLDSVRNNNANGQDDQAMWTFVTSLATGDMRYMGCGQGNSGASEMRRTSSTNVDFRSRNGNANADAGSNALGLIGMSRAASGSFTSRGGQADTSQTRTSQTPISGNVFEYATNNGGASQHSNHRSCAAFVGKAHTLATAETIIDTHIAAITALGL